jgi:hypothetical protein
VRALQSYLRVSPHRCCHCECQALCGPGGGMGWRSWDPGAGGCQGSHEDLGQQRMSGYLQGGYWGNPKGQGTMGGLGSGTVRGWAEYCRNPCQVGGMWETHLAQGARTGAPRQQRAWVGTGAFLTHLCLVPSSLVRTGVPQLKAGSFLRMPSLYLL